MLRTFMNFLKFIVIFSFFIISGCGKSDNNVAFKLRNSGNEVISAERFTLEKKKGWTEVKILNPWQGAGMLTRNIFL